MAKQPAFQGQGYEDTGCNIYHQCLSCPLPQCRYDIPVPTPSDRSRVNVNKRHVQIVALRQQGLKLTAIGLRVGLDYTSVIFHLSGNCKCQV